jgi:Fic family protein
MTWNASHTSDPLLRRIRNEFLEMPGLCLTLEQAARLWNLDPQTSQMVLRMLQEEGFLARTGDGRFVSGPVASRTLAHA